MSRTIISLPDEDKTWLVRQASSQQVPMTELVRRAVREYRQRHGNSRPRRLTELLDRTRRRQFQPPLSFPTPPSVIPDIFNRESMAFPRRSRTNKGTEENNPGFPLKPAGMTGVRLLSGACPRHLLSEKPTGMTGATPRLSQFVI